MEKCRSSDVKMENIAKLRSFGTTIWLLKCTYTSFLLHKFELFLE